MHRHLRSSMIAAALLSYLCSTIALGQERSTAPIQPESQLVALVDFDFAATGLWWMSEFVGKGVADLLTDELINNGSYRVMERKFLAAILAEQKLAGGNPAAEIGRAHV